MPEEYYGSEEKIREYKWMVYIGLVMAILGAFLSPVGKIIGIEAVYIYSLAGLFIGAMVFFSGVLGYRQETAKKGEKKVITKSGGISTSLGIASVLVSPNIPIVSIIAGIGAVLLGYRAMQKDDNVYGSTGLILGIVGLGLVSYLIYVFSFGLSLPFIF